MAATVRIAHLQGSTDVTPSSVASGKSFGTSGTTIRIAGITGDSGASLAVIRISDIVAASGSTNAIIRIGDVAGASIEATLLWDGSQWVLPPAGGSTGQSKGSGRSAGSGTPKFGGTVQSKATGKSRSTATVTGFSGSLSLAGGGNLTLAGFKNPTSGGGVGSLALTGGGSLALTGFAHDGLPGAGSVSVFPEPLNSPPRVRLTLTGFLGPTIEIVRTTAQGTVPVRLGHPATLISGSVTFYDYEAPFGVPFTYTATPTTGPGPVTSDSYTLDVQAPWLIHPSIPGLSTPVRIKQIGDKTTDTLMVLNTVLGRKMPIPETDGVRKSANFDVMFRTLTQQESQSFADIIAGADGLLLQVAYPFTPVTNYWYLAMTDVVSSAFTNRYGDPEKVWSVNCTVIDAPSGLQQAQRTVADLLAEEDTIAQMIADFATVRDVLTDNRLDGT